MVFIVTVDFIASAKFHLASLNVQKAKHKLGPVDTGQRSAYQVNFYTKHKDGCCSSKSNGALSCRVLIQIELCAVEC